MKRGLLALGGAVVLASLIGLYFALNGGSSDEAVSRHSPPRITEAESGKSRGTLAPPSPRAVATPESSGSASATDYMVGDIRVRDHRSGEHARLDVPPAVHPPEGRKIASQLTSDIAQKVRAVMTECAARSAPGARGPTPRVDGTITIAIRDHQTTIKSAIVQLRDVTGGDALKQCIEQGAVGIAVPAGDEPDVDGYAIALSLRLP